LRSGHSPTAFLVLACASALTLNAAEPPLRDAEFFEKEVRPLLVAKCLDCHGDVKPKGGLKLTSRADLLRGGDSGPAVVPGKPDDSLLVRAARHADERRMPPKEKLTARQIDALTRWVKSGAPWPATLRPAESRFTITEEQRRFWSVRPVRAVAVPVVRDAAWPRTPVDRFILSALEAKAMRPADRADKRTLLRRVTFDLIGLPPTPAEVAAFLADDSPQAFERVVDRLLASPRYGERWGRHWLDVVRYADARDLIQLPASSDFREAWRYRDWVVKAFDDDLPYRDFLQYQIAGDLLQPADPERMNADALVATGMLAIADFVPGDVDKDLMIADYVNDQIDVVGRAFMGLTLACARCHDHKFDPISTEDYYGLAGIFFSTRLVPGPIPGNTPLVRVPLMPKPAIDRARAKYQADLRRRDEIRRDIARMADREEAASRERLVKTQTARYLAAAWECKRQTALAPAEFAKARDLDAGTLSKWLAFLDSEPAKPLLAKPARSVQQSLVEVAVRREAARSPEQKALAEALSLHLRADHASLRTDAKGRVALWPDRSPTPADAVSVAGKNAPLRATAKIAGRERPVLRFSGDEWLEARRAVPPAGSLFVVYAPSPTGKPGQRLVGWEDAAVGRHGLGIQLDAGGNLQAILRNEGKSGDIGHARKAKGDFEIVSVTWGDSGTTLHRDRTAAGANAAIRAVSSDPAIAALRIGGPGSGAGPSFRGDIAEIRVYDRQLSPADRARVEAELHAAWFTPSAVDPWEELYAELVSPRGPFQPKAGDGTVAQARLAALRQELATLKDIRPLVVPEAVVVQDGGPKGSKHEGFRDAHVYIRGNHKTPGKKVQRRFPVVLAGDDQPAIAKGSGRLELARWLTRPEHPLTARVMVNRIWQHHFGEGIVRTPNNLGERGERPTHPELLDYLAGRFVESGWSVKDLHRVILLSSTYQQSTRPAEAGDPENRLFGRTNRRRLDAEAIRDSLLSVAGRLEDRMGGPAFPEMAVPRRTLYLMSARTGANTSGFASLFDRADPCSIVEKRNVSTVAPQALFFLNDPFVGAQAAALAKRLDPSRGPEGTVREVYGIVFARPPSAAELAVGLSLLEPAANVDPLERLCHALLCTNEFLYVD
jgi:hypothetical protein